MSEIGHNAVSDRELLERNLRTGMRSAGFDVLVRAAADKRLDRKALLVLAGIVWAMQHTGYATPARSALAAFAGVSLKRISNIIYDLISLGYLARITVEEEEKRVYTYGEQLDHERIEAEISRYCAELRGKKVPDIAGIFNEAAASLGEKFPEKVPGKSEKFPEIEKSSRKKFPETSESSRYGGNSHDGQRSEQVPTHYREDIINVPNGTLAPKGAIPPVCHISDIFDGTEAARPKVEVRLWDSAVAFKPAGHPKFEQITHSWIERHLGASVDIAIVREFVAAEIEDFFAEPPVDKDGKPIRLHGYLKSGFEHRLKAFADRRVKDQPKKRKTVVSAYLDEDGNPIA